MAIPQVMLMKSIVHNIQKRFVLTASLAVYAGPLVVIFSSFLFFSSLNPSGTQPTGGFSKYWAERNIMMK